MSRGCPDQTIIFIVPHFYELCKCLSCKSTINRISIYFNKIFIYFAYKIPTLTLTNLKLSSIIYWVSKKTRKGSPDMSIIGNIFALCILLTVSIVFFQNRYYLTLASKHFAVSLIVTMTYCIVSIVLSEANTYTLLTPVITHIIGFLEGALLISASTIIALYVVLKAIDHTYNHLCEPELYFTFPTICYT